MDKSLSRMSDSRTLKTVALSSYQTQHLRKLKWLDSNKPRLIVQLHCLVQDQECGQVLHSLSQGHDQGNDEENQHLYTHRLKLDWSKAWLGSEPCNYAHSNHSQYRRKNSNWSFEFLCINQESACVWNVDVCLSGVPEVLNDQGGLDVRLVENRYVRDPCCGNVSLYDEGLCLHKYLVLYSQGHPLFLECSQHPTGDQRSHRSLLQWCTSHNNYHAHEVDFTSDLRWCNELSGQ